MILVYIPITAKKVPLNYCLLIAHNFVNSYNVAFITMFYNKNTVILASLLTAVMVISLTIYAWNTKRDFTIYGMVLFLSLIVLIFASILSFFIRIPLFHFIISVISVVLFGFYLIYDT